MVTFTMTTLSMVGPLKLNTENIDKLIKAHSPGNFALGFIEGKAFIVKQIGRSDYDLNQKLKDSIGKYSHFKWSYASSPKEAFIKECQNYHDFGGCDELDNDFHPVKPGGEYLMCDYCGM